MPQIKAKLFEFYRTRFVSQRDRVWDQHREGAGGLDTVRAYTGLVDGLLREMFEKLAEHHGGKKIRSRLALVPLGGYGRGELNPFSDIDLMFLVDGRVAEEQKEFISDFLTMLWDMKFTVGHSCRSIRDCRNQLHKDIVSTTAMLESRYLTGHGPLYEKFETKVKEDYIRRNRAAFIRRKIEKIESRHAAHEGSQYTLEPNIKEGVGGLRDIHSAMWIEQAAHGIRDLDELLPSNLLDGYDLAAVKTGFDLLLKVRTELHLLAGRKQDILDMNYQDQISRRFGFRDTRNRAAVENFMSFYYLNVEHICHFLNVTIERERRNPSIFRVEKPQDLDDDLLADFVLADGRIALREDGNKYFAGEAGVHLLVAIFRAAHRHRLGLSDHLLRCIRRSIPLVRLQLMYLQDMHQFLWEVLKSKAPATRTLRLMHQTELLSAIIPEFEGITCLYQYDYYHQFTVDEHTFRVLEQAEELVATEDAELLSIRRAAEKISRPEILRLTVLLHDVGKAEGRAEHVQNGVRMAERVCERLEADPEVTRAIKFLVENHLVMSRMAHRRDLSDPQVIIHFNEIVGSPEVLRHLYVLTCADIRGVSRGSWTGWKGALLEELFLRSMDAFTRGVDALGAAETEIATRIRELMPGQGPEEVIKTHLAQMPERYVRECEPEEIAEHLQLIGLLQSRKIATMVKRLQRFSGLTVCTRDRAGLFADITGVVAGCGFDVWSAKVFTRGDGIALDTFLLQHGGVPLGPEHEHLLEEHFQSVFTGRENIEELVKRQETRIVTETRPPSLRPPRVYIDNESSQAYTILDVYAQDSPGMLFRISRAISELGLSIHLAKISTDVDQLLDVFYVTNRAGNKVLDPQELDRIELSLLRALERVKQLQMHGLSAIKF